MIIKRLNKKIVNIINNTRDRIEIELNNTKSINSFLLDSISNKKCTFIIYGGLSEIDFLPRYKKRITYNLDEMKSIIKKFELLEKNMPNDTFDKILYIYDYIRKNISYYKGQNDHELRSLLIVVNNKAVCSGYALLLKELLVRQNIKCKYIKYYNHIWNKICINKKYYDVDVTWDACVYSECKSSNLHYFSNNIYLKYEHHNYLSNSNYLHNNLIKKYDLLKMFFKRDDNSNFELTMLPIGYKRKYYLLIENNHKYIVSSDNDFEIIISRKDKNIISSYINCFFTNERVLKYMNNNLSYLGYGIIKDGCFYRKKKNYYDDYIEKIEYINDNIFINTKDGIYKINKDNYFEEV